MRYRLTRRAERDIIDLYLWGCRDHGMAQAERYHAGLAATFDVIADHPHLARERPEIEPPVRLHPYRSHLIIYREDGDGVLIVRVLHGRQDWEAVL